MSKTFEAAMIHLDRDFLAMLRASAEMAERQGSNVPYWQSACRDLARAADRVDAILARNELKSRTLG